MASGCLSMPKEQDIQGAERFTGDVYFTSRWPHEGVDFTGKQVGVIGTGSSGIQVIPLIAEQAAQLTVFQRTANFSIPAHNGPASAERLARLADDREAYREEARRSPAGVPVEISMETVAQLSEEERRKRFEEAWEEGHLLGFGRRFADILVNRDANEVVCEMIRERIREIVDDPETAEMLCPRDFPLATKRMCLDSGYYATFNRANVRLVDLRRQPITTVTETGVDTADESFELDAIVYATGFDAMTGALVAVDITGRDGVTLKQKWEHGPVTYLGLTTVGFPNLFMITGPGSPSVLSNMAVSIEQHVDWVADRIAWMSEHDIETIEPTETAEAGWVQHVNDCADITLFPTANSWYMGANVPGKPRVFLPYIGGVDRYKAVCDEVVERDLLGFRLTGPAGTQCHDGIVRRLQPDVAIVLETMEQMGVPPLETLSVDEARQLHDHDGCCEAARVRTSTRSSTACSRARRATSPIASTGPTAAGPSPIVVYFHGGGWVLGAQDSDDPLCRDLCVRSGAIVVSVNYRHAPEARFPAPVDDALAAVTWVADHAVELGGIPGPIAVAGWSAGANLATITCRLARDAGGPEIAGQLLLCPVTDCDLARDVLCRQRRRVLADHRTHGVVLGPLRRSRRPVGSPRFAVACR